jgi:uncharacterized protein YjiS (DUF1127 family)
MAEHVYGLNQKMVDDGRHAGFGKRVHRAVAQAANWVLTWQERARTRHALSSLDDRMLDDLGISFGDALHEGGKPFWRD